MLDKLSRGKKRRVLYLFDLYTRASRAVAQAIEYEDDVEFVALSAEVGLINDLKQLAWTEAFQLMAELSKFRRAKARNAFVRGTLTAVML